MKKEFIYDQDLINFRLATPQSREQSLRHSSSNEMQNSPHYNNFAAHFFCLAPRVVGHISHLINACVLDIPCIGGASVGYGIVSRKIFQVIHRLRNSQLHAIIIDRSYNASCCAPSITRRRSSTVCGSVFVFLFFSQRFDIIYLTIVRFSRDERTFSREKFIARNSATYFDPK